MSAAAGPGGEGCLSPPDNVPRTTCSLPKAAGSCSGWTGRYFYDVTTAKCSHFWYGGCRGNNNNFLTRRDCQSRCPGARTSHTYQPSQSGTGHDMSKVFTVQRGSSGGSKGTNAAHHAHTARVHVRPRRPATYSVQQTHPAASLTQPGGVKIDQSDPSTVEALVGQTVVLPCRVSPAPSSTVIVEWRKDGVPLTTFR
uniref:BPTI/Kunitz inhibitor domain-containing protein n=1 Tax=Hucho hucho TaxID=62062 RepID=A0A4W5P0X6_9TELE